LSATSSGLIAHLRAISAKRGTQSLFFPVHDSLACRANAGLLPAEAIRQPAQSGRNQDRAEPLTRLAQSDKGTLLVTAYGARLHRQDHRLDHPFKPTATDLKQEQQAENTAQQRCDRYQQHRDNRMRQDGMRHRIAGVGSALHHTIGQERQWAGFVDYNSLKVVSPEGQQIGIAAKRRNRRGISNLER
jgi:hypothetical protein